MHNKLDTLSCFSEMHRPTYCNRGSRPILLLWVFVRISDGRGGVSVAARLVLWN